MHKHVYSLEKMRELRVLVDGVPPPSSLALTGAFDHEGAKRLAKVKSAEELPRAGMPPKQLSQDSMLTRDGLFGSGAKRKDSSPLTTKWVYRRKSGTSISAERSWQDIEALIDDMLVEKEELEVRPSASSGAFMTFDEAVAFRAGKVSVPTSPNSDWRASAGQRLGNNATRPPPPARLPHSPSFEAQAAPQHRASWTRDDMQQTRASVIVGIQALGADIDELDLGIGTIQPLPAHGSTPDVTKEEARTPAKLAASTSSDGVPRAPMPMMPAPIDLGDIVAVDDGLVPPLQLPSAASAEVIAPKETGDGNGAAKTAKKRKEPKADPPSPAQAKGPAKNAWGTASAAQVDFQTVMSEVITAPKAPPAGKKASEWDVPVAKSGAGDLPSLSDVGSGVSRKAAKEAKLHKHTERVDDSGNFWEAKPAVVSQEAFPSLEQAMAAATAPKQTAVAPVKSVGPGAKKRGK